MNICHVITRLIVGGAQENTVLSCRGLVDRGHHVTLLAGPETGREGSLWRRAHEAECDVVEVGSLRRAISPLRDWRAYRQLRRHFERIRPDVVHTHSSKAGIIGRFAAAAAGVPVIVHTIHGMSFNRTQSAAVRETYRLLERRAARDTSAFVTVADAMRDQAAAAGVAPADRFVTIRSGIEVDRFAPSAELRAKVRGEWGVANGEVVIGTIARLFANKGYEEIIEAMPAALAGEPLLRFVWVGDGPHRRRYEVRLDALGLRDRVLMLGLASPCDIPAIVNGFDTILHASRWEGLPRAVVQGLLAEVPAVSFDNDGAPEIVINGRTGVLVPYGCTKGLTEGLLKLAADAPMRRALGAAGRELCVRQFDWRTMVAELEALYLRLVARQTLPCADEIAKAARVN